MLSIVIYCTHKLFEGAPAEAMGPVSPLRFTHLFIHLYGTKQDDLHDSLGFKSLLGDSAVSGTSVSDTVSIVTIVQIIDWTIDTK